MTQDFKCALGLHKLKLMETREVKDSHGEVVKVIYITQCENCGKIYTKQVNYESCR